MLESSSCDTVVGKGRIVDINNFNKFFVYLIHKNPSDFFSLKVEWLSLCEHDEDVSLTKVLIFCKMFIMTRIFVSQIEKFKYLDSLWFVFGNLKKMKTN